MRKVDTRPTAGQFVEMWEHNGIPWATVIRIDDDGEHEYNAKSDKWHEPLEPSEDMRIEWYVI